MSSAIKHSSRVPLKVQAKYLPFRVVPFVLPANAVRHILKHRVSDQPVVAASLYEIHLAYKTDSPNTRKTSLHKLAYLYSWAESASVRIDELLLKGEGLSVSQVREFSSWLRKRWENMSGKLNAKNREACNKILQECESVSIWFIEQFSKTTSANMQRASHVQCCVNLQSRAWKECRQKTPKQKIASDLSDNEIASIEAFLLPGRRQHSVGPALAARNYLIWRMVIECGMRIGEVLAMRIQDCPSREHPYFRIVRIEDREPDYFDPRGVYAPRPKTLSRDLGFLLRNTRFPRLIGEYVSTFRYVSKAQGAGQRRKFVLPHDFLLISRSGAPLSISAAESLANQIRNHTGVPFHWHLGRHAFFNRAYSGIAEIEDNTERQIKLQDLVYWGGWNDESSLEIYTRRTRRERARQALRIWQHGENAWTALD